MKPMTRIVAVTLIIVHLVHGRNGTTSFDRAMVHLDVARGMIWDTS